MEKIDVTAMEIRDYAMSSGWVLVKDALKDGLFVLNSPALDKTQLIFPKDDSVQEFQELASVSIQRLAKVTARPFQNIVEEIREVNDDVLSLRYYSDNKIVNSISFEEALESITAARQMLLAAASSVVNPARFHPKLNRLEPQELIKKTKFRHTEQGSFIIKISCPFEYVSAGTGSLFPDEQAKPLSRKAIELINISSAEILNSIETNTAGELYDRQGELSAPIISYNFCDALAKLYDEERELPYELVFSWSKASKLRLPFPSLKSRINFPFSHRSKIEEVKDYFAPKKQAVEGAFFGTVETLNGDEGEDGRRAGEVILSLLYENELLKTRVILDAESYSTALRAHKQGGAYVKVAGKLKRNKRICTIDEISEFVLTTS